MNDRRPAGFKKILPSANPVHLLLKQSLDSETKASGDVNNQATVKKESIVSNEVN